MAKDTTPENPPAAETAPTQNPGNVYTPPADGREDKAAAKAKNPPARDAFAPTGLSVKAEPAPETKPAE